MKHISILIILTLILSGCNNSYNKKASYAISPMQAISLTAAAAPGAVDGVFELTVKSGDCHQRLEFLNSESDSKDQRNLIIALRPNAVQELTDKYGIKPSDYFIGKTIKVIGEAKRVKIWTLFKGKNTKNYHYQTQIFVKSADQLTII